jgi:hypothetical protein
VASLSTKWSCAKIWPLDLSMESDLDGRHRKPWVRWKKGREIVVVGGEPGDGEEAGCYGMTGCGLSFLLFISYLISSPEKRYHEWTI